MIGLTKEKLSEYKDAKFYQGSMVRYLLQDYNKDSVHCAKCRNIANGVVVVENKPDKFNVPLCKVHFVEIFPETTNLPIVKYYTEPKEPSGLATGLQDVILARAMKWRKKVHKYEVSRKNLFCHKCGFSPGHEIHQP